MNTSHKNYIVVTLGPASAQLEVLREIAKHHVYAFRLNFSWGNIEEHTAYIEIIRKVEKELNIYIPIIIDLPGPRIQKFEGHTYDAQHGSALTEEDKHFIQFAVEQQVQYVAVSFVGNEKEIVQCRELISSYGGKQKVIAKIERKEALHHLDSIVAESDVVMVARGDLGNEVPYEQIPFIQQDIVSKAKKQNKEVIVATQMLISMVHSPEPSRAEVTDVANAIIQGSDAVMLSEESAIGQYPVQAVEAMERIVLEAEKHLNNVEKGIQHKLI